MTSKYEHTGCVGLPVGCRSGAAYRAWLGLSWTGPLLFLKKFPTGFDKKMFVCLPYRAFHQKFLCGLRPPPFRGKRVVDKTAEPMKSFSVTPPFREGRSARPLSVGCGVSRRTGRLWIETYIHSPFLLQNSPEIGRVTGKVQRPVQTKNAGKVLDLTGKSVIVPFLGFFDTLYGMCRKGVPFRRARYSRNAAVPRQ